MYIPCVVDNLAELEEIFISYNHTGCSEFRRAAAALGQYGWRIAV